MWLVKGILTPGRALSFEQYPSEGPAEVLVEDSVDDRVESGVHVAEPESDGEGKVWDVTDGTNGGEDVEEEEGEPAGYEGAHDEAQDESGTLFFLPSYPPFLPLRVTGLLHLRTRRRQTH